MPSPPVRTESLNLRLRPETKRLLQQAAAIAGQSVTDFVITIGAERARQLIEQHHVVTMNQAAFEKFCHLLDDPSPQPLSPELQEGFSRYAAAKQSDGTFRW